MEILSGPSSQGDRLHLQVLRDKEAEMMEKDYRYFHPLGRAQFKAEHGFDYPHPITPFEEALQQFQLKQRKVREAALKKSLMKKVSG